MNVDLTNGIGGFAIIVIGYFIKKVISNSEANHFTALNEIKELETKVNTNTTKIEVLSANHSNIEKKIDNIFEALKDISTDIKHLNSKK